MNTNIKNYRDILIKKQYLIPPECMFYKKHQYISICYETFSSISNCITACKSMLALNACMNLQVAFLPSICRALLRGLLVSLVACLQYLFARALDRAFLFYFSTLPCLARPLPAPILSSNPLLFSPVISISFAWRAIQDVSLLMTFPNQPKLSVRNFSS